MNIAVLLHSGAGGSGVVATELGLALARKGHSVHFVADRVPFRLTSLSHHNVYYHQVQSMTYPLFNAPLTTLAEASKLTEVIENYNIEVIHAHYAVPHATAAIMARSMVHLCGDCRPPAVVTTLHGTDVTLVGLDHAYLRTTQYAIESSDVTTAVSQYLADYTHQEMGVRSPIRVVHNTIDFERFSPRQNLELRHRYAHPDEKLIIHVSNFREVKRTPDVIRAFAKIASTVSARLIMIGDGPERQTCLDLANSLHVGGRVSFLGSFPQVEEVMAMCDLMMVPSAKESFGLVALEAMACGLPTISSNIGGLPEVVEDGVTGFTHDLGDTQAMANSALTLLTSPETYAAFSQAARARAITVFGEDNVLPLYERAYADALAKGDTQPSALWL